MAGLKGRKEEVRAEREAENKGLEIRKDEKKVKRKGGGRKE